MADSKKWIGLLQCKMAVKLYSVSSSLWTLKKKKKYFLNTDQFCVTLWEAAENFLHDISMPWIIPNNRAPDITGMVWDLAFSI